MTWTDRTVSGETWDTEWGNSAGKLAEGLDVRGEGGYIVAPPSSTMRRYEVLEDLALADTPARIIEALRKPQRAVSGRRIAAALHLPETG